MATNEGKWGGSKNMCIKTDTFKYIIIINVNFVQF